MSAYAHQMDREFSGLSSRGNSELGSRYWIDSGCYMTSLAASIFIASLVTFGVLMVTLLIALSTMLQSCENRSSDFLRFKDLKRVSVTAISCLYTPSSIAWKKKKILNYHCYAEMLLYAESNKESTQGRSIQISACLLL